MKRNLLIFIAMLFTVFGVVRAETIRTESISDSTVRSITDANTTIKSPPASAISPTINTSNSDLCTVGVAGAVQTQILGISAGKTVRDLNCERLKLSKTLFDMGMKVAAVSTLCQDRRVFDAMMQSGTPCPYDGTIGQEAKAQWKANEDQQPEKITKKKGLDDADKTLLGGGGIIMLLLLLLL